MYFVSQKSDTPGAQLATYARFYYEKFPEAFQTEADSDSNASENEEKDLIWTADEHELAFRNFDERCRKFVKAEDAIGLLNFIAELKHQIEGLPISTKEAECTIQRFMLYLLPVFNLAYAKDPVEAHSIVSKFSSILIECKNFSVQSKVTSLLHMYNATQKGIKAMIFVRLTKLCSD
jgi:hypothetical protein